MPVIVDCGVVKGARGVRVVEHGHVDGNFTTAARADVGRESREPDVQVDKLVGEELGAGDGAGGGVVRVCEDSRPAETREGGECDGGLVGVHVGFREFAPG